MHHFSDTSLAGYGQCSYLRLLNKNNQAYCSFLTGKARVTLLKLITVHRLESQAAVVSIKISQWLLKELGYQDVSEFFWTLIRVVIGYINNETKRFHTLVANRIQQIHDHTGPQQWQYIESKSNPSLETQGQIVGTRESLKGRKNVARRKVKNGEKSPWGQCLTRTVPNGRRRSGF